jgi:hypothetical protein
MAKVKQEVKDIYVNTVTKHVTMSKWGNAKKYFK